MFIVPGAALRLSVVIPIYNARQFIAAAIDGVLADGHPAEVIVVDDGSTDGGLALTEVYGDRIVRLSRPNGGIGAARNTGLAAASGEYVVFLDADDVFQGPFLTSVAAFAASSGPDLVFSPSGSRRRTGLRLWDHGWPSKSRHEIALDIAAGRTVGVHAVAYRTAMLRAAGGYRHVFREDTELLLRLLLGGASYGFNAMDPPFGSGILAVWCVRDNHDGNSTLQTEWAYRTELQWHAEHRAALPLAGDPRLVAAYGLRCYRLAGAAFEAGHATVGRDAIALARAFGLRGHHGSEVHRALATVLGLERKILLARSWRRLRSRVGLPKPPGGTHPLPPTA